MSPSPSRWLFTLVLVCAGFASRAEAADETASFKPGDRFVYDLHWSFIKVGKAELEFDHAALEPGGPELLHAVFTVRTAGIADKLFKVRDRIESWMDPDSGRPQRYVKIQREGKTKRDVLVEFDWEAMTATYSDRGVAREPVTITEDTFDPLSLITALARHSFAEIAQLSQATTDGKKLVYIEATLKERERLNLRSGKYDAYQIDVATNELKGVFEKSPDASIEVWFSDDQPAIPLKMRSEVAVGSFHGELREGTYQGRAIGK